MKETNQPLKLAAIDLDGTLLGPDRTISDANLRALESLVQAGVEVVLASGRHYDSMLPYIEHLPMVNWIVSTQGAEVSNRNRSKILHRIYLKPDEVSTLVQGCRQHGLTDVSYAPLQVLTTSDNNPLIDLYARLSGRTPLRIDTADLVQQPIHKMLWMGKPEQISRLKEGPVLPALNLQTVQTFNEIYEIMPLNATKAEGLAALIARLRIKRSEVAVFGDADNDISMFEWAGKSFCMPHGWPSAKQSAQYVVPAKTPQTALASAIEACLSLQAATS